MLTILNVVPSSGSPIGPLDTVAFDLLDYGAPGTVVTAAFRNTLTEIVFDGTNFRGYYANPRSSRTAITNGWHFVIYRAGGWVDAPVIDAIGFGVGIQRLTTFSLDYTDLAALSSPANLALGDVLPTNTRVLHIEGDLTDLFDDGGGNVDMRLTVFFPTGAGGTFVNSNWLGSYKVGTAGSPPQYVHTIGMSGPAGNNGSFQQGGQQVNVQLTSSTVFSTLTAGHIDFSAYGYLLP